MFVISVLFFGSSFCSYCSLRTNLCFLFDGFTDVVLQKVKVFSLSFTIQAIQVCLEVIVKVKVKEPVKVWQESFK